MAQRQFPIQHSRELRREQLSVPEPVYMAAYEVYCELHGFQQALIEKGCRGGFGIGELVVFLYARQFPKKEWKQKASEAWEGMKL